MNPLEHPSLADAVAELVAMPVPPSVAALQDRLSEFGLRGWRLSLNPRAIAPVVPPSDVTPDEEKTFAELVPYTTDIAWILARYDNELAKALAIVPRDAVGFANHLCHLRDTMHPCCVTLDLWAREQLSQWARNNTNTTEDANAPAQ